MNGLLDLGSGDLPIILATAALKGFIVLCAAAGFCLLLRRSSASLRHLCWSVALVSLLVIPLLTAVLPSVSVGILSAPPSTSAAATFAAAEAPRDSAPQVVDEAAPPAAVPVVVEAETPSLLTGATLFALWAFVAAAILLHMLFGMLGVRRLIHRSTPVNDRGWRDLVDEIGDRLFIRRPVRLLMSSSVRVPMTWGVLRPVVLLPAEAEGWSEEKRRCVLAHEMAHVKRLDCLTQGIATTACALHWFNPMAWRAAKNMRLEREKACDDSVLKAARTKASDYATHLLDIARSVPESLAAPSVAVTMARRSQLEGRVLSILDRDRRRSFRPGPAAAAVVFGAVATLALSPVQPAALEAELDVEIGHEQRAVATPERALSAAAVPEPDPEPKKVIADSAPVDDVIKRSFTASPGGRLSIDTDRGSIEIRTSDRNVVDVEVHRRIRGDADVDDFTVEFEQDGDEIEILGENRRNWERSDDGVNVQFIVTVPRQFDLDLETAGGNISIDDLDGTADVHTSGGNLSFGRIRGSIDASTSGGNVSIDGSEGNVDVETSGGNIRLGRVGGTVDVRTSGGNIYVEEVNGDIDAVTSGGMIEAHLARQPEGDCLLKTSGGSITVYLAEGIAVDIDAQTSAGHVISDVDVAMSGQIRKDRLRGTINGGGPDLVLDTSAGDVRIRRL